MKRIKGNRGWIAAAFTILFTIGSITVRTKAATPPSGEAPQTLTAPVLSDLNNGVACPSDTLFWTSVTGATSYGFWSRELAPTPESGFVQGTNQTGTHLKITLSDGFAYAYKVTACDAQGCSGFSNTLDVTEGECP
jgi:hypothetical protein